MIDAVRFGNIHSFRDLNLILNSKTISAPKPKTYYVDIDGADGTLDFTDVFGDVKYEERDITLKFSWLKPSTDYLEKWSKIQSLLHGRKFKIIFDSDPMYYYIGRCTLDKWTLKKVVGSFSVKIQCEPYKYHLEPTQVELNVNGDQKFILKNDRKKVMPTFHATADMTLTINGEIITIKANQTGYSSSIQLEEGNNILRVVGNGNLTVMYQQGSL